MAYPNFSEKHNEEAIIQPARFLEYLRSRGAYPPFPPPQGIILCYQRRLLDYILANHRTTKPEHGRGVHLLDETEGRVGVLGGFGIGAPAAVTLLEEFIALGVPRFLSVGTAGSLQPQIGIGDLVVCDRAIRDEGVSHHYLAPEKYAPASPALTERLIAALTAGSHAFTRGTSWTIDAPYRETRAEVAHYQGEGAACVEMEAAALFAVAQYRGVEIGAMFTITDSLASLEWHPEFHSERTQQGLETLYQTALSCLVQPEKKEIP
jgi:uridine phosphorylase